MLASYLSYRYRKTSCCSPAMLLSQLNSVFQLFELFSSFTVILLLLNLINISIVIHLHYLTTLFYLLSYYYCTYNVMVIKFPCKICNKGVVNNNHAIQCDKCHSWIHIKCNKINLSTYRYLQFSNIFTPGIG